MKKGRVIDTTAPPHSMEAEQGLIGSILLSPDEWIDRAAEEVNAGSFFHPPHGTIFQAIQELSKMGFAVDFITLTQFLRDRNELVLVGGPAAISTLYTFTPTSANATHYAAIVKDSAARRKLLSVMTELAPVLHGPEPIEDAITRLNTELASLDPASRGEHVLPAMAEKALATVERARQGNAVRGQPTFFPWWENFFGGLVEGGYYGIGARPGMGKSAMMEQIMASLLQHSVPVCCFAQDMAPDILLERMACRMAGVSKWSLDHGRLSGDQLDDVQGYIEGLRDSPLRLHCLERMTGEQMIMIARREFRKHKVKHFFLDHVQTIHVPKGQERNEAWAEASQLVRKFASTNGVSWTSLAHLNREAAKEAARAHQIRGFDDLLGDVDGLVLLDSNQNPGDLQPGQPWEMSMIVDKNRGGPCGSKPLLFERALMAFTAAPTN